MWPLLLSVRCRPVVVKLLYSQRTILNFDG